MLDDPSNPALRPPVDDEETDRIAAKYAAQLDGAAQDDGGALTIDRYIHASVRSHGGMGRVFVAYDPELDRHVALKALPVGLGPEDPVAGVPRREGQALAHIDHPNVVRVFELIEYRGLACLVLEYVDGLNLGQWLKASPRGWQDALSKFLLAGEGLAAVHRAGFVHCDFKPTNVVVGVDGTVKLIDFGLATRPGAPMPGALEYRAGTPRYMAPEQSEGGHVDDRTDQFSFCVALYEAVLGIHPYLSQEVAASVETANGALDADAEQATRRTMIAQIRRGALQRPGPLPSGLPSTVVRALERGLSLDPRTRHPSMTELLGELRRDPRRTRRRALYGLTGALAVAGGLYATVVPGTCPELPEEQARAWNGQREVVAARLAAFGDGPLAQLDRAAGELAEARVAACDAAVRGAAQPTDLARDACLHTRQAEFTALLHALAASDGPGLARLAANLSELPTAAACAEPARLRYSCADDGISASARIGGVAALLAGDVTRSEALAREASRTAEASGAVGSRALAHVLLGRLAYERGEWARAEQELLTAEELAEPGICLAIAAEGYHWLVKLAAFDTRIPVARGEEYSRHQEYRLTGPVARADMLSNRGLLAERRLGDPTGAEALYRQAIALRTGLFDRSVAQADTYLNLASVLYATGRLDEARAALRESEQRRGAAVGPAHPDHAKHLHNLGLIALERGDLVEAIALIEQARAQAAKSLRPDAPIIGDFAVSLAQAHDRSGDRDAALAAANDAVRVYAGDDARASAGLEAVAQVLIDMEKYDEALGPLAQAERLLSAPDVPLERLGILDFKYAEAHNGLGRHAEAGDRAASALRRFDAAGLPAYNDLRAHASLILGEALLGQQRWREAAAPFERAVAIWRASGANPERLAWARWGLAQAVCRVPDRRAEVPRIAAEAAHSIAEISVIENDPTRHHERRQLLASVCRPR